MNVKVSTVAFSINQYLVERLKELFPFAQVNSEGKRIPDELLPQYFAGAEGIIVGLENINAKLLDQLPDLKIIAKYGVGLDNVDLEACRERNITVGWTGGVNRRSVAEMALGFMLSLLRNLYSTSNQLKDLTWNKSGGIQLSGKTVGIIGLGHIGKELVHLLSPFNCNILVNDIADISDFVSKNMLSEVSLNELLSQSDIISIHTPLTSQTRNLIDAVSLHKMKPGAFVINTSRGGIINESALKFALLNKIISGAALDVYEVEPPIDRELLSLPNVICTPHIGGNSYEAVIAMGLSALNHLNNYKIKYKLS